MVDYYDKILVGMAAAIVAGAGASAHPAVATYQGLASGSLLATVLLFETLFRNPPTEPPRSRRAASAIVGAGWLVTVLASL